MLDSALKQTQHKDIDWVFAQKAISEWLRRALFWWIIFVMFAAPLFVFLPNYGANSSRMLFFASGCAVGWIIFLARELFGNDRFLWRASFINFGLFALFLSVAAVFLGQGGFNMSDAANQLGPVSWLSLILFCALVSQSREIKARHIARASLSGFAVLFFGFYLITTFITEDFTGDIARKGESLVAVSSKGAVSRFFEYNSVDDIVFGAGLGKGKMAFWESAERVTPQDFSSELPAVGGSYARMLWDGGIILLLGFFVFSWVFCARAFALSRRAVPKTPMGSLSRDAAKRAVWVSAGIIAALFVLWFVKLTFLVLFGFAAALLVLERYLALALGPARAPRVLRLKAAGAPLRFLRIILAAMLIAFAVGVWVVLFPSAEWFGAGAYASRAENIYQEFTRHPDAFARDASLASGRLRVLQKDAQEFSPEDLSGPQNWRMGRAYVKAADIARQVNASESAEEQMFSLAARSYEAALSKMRRNTILALEAARFFRKRADNPRKSIKVLTRTLEIDPGYHPARVEKANAYIDLEDTQSAILELEPYASESPDIAYTAGHLAMAEEEFEKSAGLFKQAIEQNPKHLQARFELAQSYIGLARMQKALDELSELEEMIDEGDTASLEAINKLREMIE